MDDRNVIFLYCQGSLRLTGQLDDAIALYDRSHHLHLDRIESDRESMVALQDAAHRLNGDLGDLVQQQANLQPVPPAAARDFQAWQASVKSYAQWGDVTDRLLAEVSEGHFGTGLGEEGSRLVNRANKERKNAEKESFQLFNSMRQTGASRFNRLLPSPPPILKDERTAVLKYFEDSLRVSSIQDEAANSYNAAVDANRSTLSNPRSLRISVSESERLVTTANDLITRQSQLVPLPSTFAHYAAWTFMFSDYRHWADIQHTFFVLLSIGQTPDPRWVKALMAASERRRAEAQAEGIKLLRAIRVTQSEVANFAVAADGAITEASQDGDPL